MAFVLGAAFSVLFYIGFMYLGWWGLLVMLGSIALVGWVTST